MAAARREARQSPLACRGRARATRMWPRATSHLLSILSVRFALLIFVYFIFYILDGATEIPS